jgi:hypothetical protein
MKRAYFLLALLTIGCASGESIPGAPSPSGRQAVAAPIDRVNIRVIESNPVQYAVNVLAGLPSGCAERNRHEVNRAADVIIVTVLNWMPTGSPACTMIYGTYELSVDLGSDFRSGTTYTVNVNETKMTFVAR